jgi:hypothetical protein
LSRQEQGARRRSAEGQLTQRLYELEAAHVRHVEVGYDYGNRIVRGDNRECLFRVVAAAAVETSPSQCPLENRERGEIVIEEKDCLFHVAVCGSR